MRESIAYQKGFLLPKVKFLVGLLLLISLQINLRTALDSNDFAPSFFIKNMQQLHTKTNTTVKAILKENQLPNRNYFAQEKRTQLQQLTKEVDIWMPSTAVCPDIDIIDLRNVPGFAQLDDLNICGTADTLSFMIFTGDLGQIKGFELTLDLSDGVEYAGWEFVQLGNTSINVTKAKNKRPEFYIDGITGDSLVIANIGIRSNCEVDKTKSLFIDFEYEYTFIDTADMVHKCSGTFRPALEINSAVHEPVLNLLSPLSPAEVTVTSVGGTFCQELQISQDGLNAYLDSFTLEIIGLDFSMGDVILDSILANNIKIPTGDITFNATTLTSEVLLDGTYFTGNAAANPADNQMNTNEIITIDVCYSISQCLNVSQIPFQYKVSYGCDGNVCQASVQNTILVIEPTGATMPTATISLNTGGAEICGTPAMVSLTMTNPNVDTDATVYEDVTIGFQTCDKPNLEVTGVTINGITLPDSLYSWVGDDINIDFTKNTLTTLGLADYDSDTFYDDLPGGNSINAIVEIGIVCGINTSEDCVAIICKDVQFYVDAKTNCDIGSLVLR